MIPVHSVMADSMATIVLLDKNMELIPEPIRMQPSITLSVDFDEYIRFCSIYLGTTDYLSSPTDMIKKYLRDGDRDSLLKSFYTDMSHSVCKELHYAEQYDKDATHIYHYIYDATISMTVQEIESLYAQVRRFTETSLRHYMKDRQFELPQFFRKANRSAWHYANVLKYYSMAPASYWSPEI